MSTVETNPRLEYELTVCEIERELEYWRAAKSIAERAGGYDGEANQRWQNRQMRMDYLLEDLFSKMGNTAIEAGDGPSA